MSKKTVFISHPYANNPMANKRTIENICYEIWKNKDLIPLSPIHLFSFMDDDLDRNKILEVCEYLIDKADLFYLYGNSVGCLHELNYARKKNKKIIDFRVGQDLFQYDCPICTQPTLGTLLQACIRCEK